jgi:hypothetical protein
MAMLYVRNCLYDKALYKDAWYKEVPLSRQ